MKKLDVIIGALICLLIVAFVASRFIKLPSGVITDLSRSNVSISAVILPHHDLVKRQRQQFLGEIKKNINTPETVILLSPNHYLSGTADIQTTDQIWEITSGQISPDLEVIKALEGLASNEPGSFANEHGIKLVLADLWQQFPDSKIVPLIFKTGVAKQKLERLETLLTANCRDCLLVASVDFSHYQPTQLADLHDQLAIRSLTTLNIDKILTDVEVDSPPALALAIMWAKAHQTEKFTVSNHTNSGLITSQPDAEGTSHLFATYSTGKEQPVEPVVSFIIGGDVMFGRSIAHNFLSGGLAKSFDQLGDRVFWGTDSSIVNLEGPISATAVPDNEDPNNLHFNFPPETINAIKYIKVKAVSLANNHSGNAGSTGLETTRALLTKAGIQPLSGPGNGDIDRVVSFEGEGLALDIIGVHSLVSQPDLAPLIKKLKTDPTHRVLVFPHWGVEYQPKHSSLQEKLAHSWIDAGADLVIGAHPHVIQDAEIYKNRPIFYSLGNLLFDQTFSKETQQGLIVAGEITNNNIRLFALPVESKKLKPTLMRGEVKSKILDTLYSTVNSFIKTESSGRVVDLPSN